MRRVYVEEQVGDVSFRSERFRDVACQIPQDGDAFHRALAVHLAPSDG
jgi:hypothetical protein